MRPANGDKTRDVLFLKDHYGMERGIVTGLPV